MNDYSKIIQTLVAENVEFIIIGGAAAFAHGASRLTEDFDIVYARNQNNLHNLVRALEPLKPRLREAPDDLPFKWDAQTLQNGMNFTLATSAGPLDLFGEIAGGPIFENLVEDTITLNLFGSQCLCLNLPRLIKVKEAAGRAKDLSAIDELKILLEEQNRK